MRKVLLALIVIFILGSLNVYSQASQCSDSDEGRNFYVKGTMGINVDYCFGNNSLAEYYCNENGQGVVEEYKCPNGCKDGVCLSEKTLKPVITVISPNGGEILQGGNIYIIEWQSVDVPLDGPNAQVALYSIRKKDGQKTLLANSLPSTGIYSWNIPTTIQKGDYVIYAEYLFAFTTNIISDESDKIFTIVSDSKCGNNICEEGEKQCKTICTRSIPAVCHESCEYTCPGDCNTSPACPINCECDQKGNVISCDALKCPANCNCDNKGNIISCSTIKCPVNCNCDEKGNTISCTTFPQCPANCNCDDKGNVISCETTIKCPVGCNCDEKSNIIKCESTAKCPVDCTCDNAGNVIECTKKISCPPKCKCDSNGNILDCDKSECIDSDGGKNYYEKGKVFVPHSDSTYADECAYEKKGYESYDHNLLFEAYCFVDKYGYGYDYYSCPNGCKDSACIPFYEKIEEVQTKTEKGASSPECSNEVCKEISKKCLGSDKIVIEQCTFYIKSNNKCEEITNTNSRILKGECDDKEVNQVVTFCQGCQLDESTCIPFGTRLEKKDSAYYCDITKNMIEQKENKITCQNSYECMSNNCKSGFCKPICEGCLNEDKACVPVGTRTSTQYCNSDYSFKNQNSEENSCNNNYECSSNLCVNNKCISPSLMQKIIDWFKKLFG
ncbi:hypothetical protein HYX00_04720 [Candidatus Woesearchaeota archaeon]|nr:hypothetical protein [Candidatus Woesearchaeota archaeon]